jgi:DNA-binding NarL/FixJ family response regulator
LRNAVEVSGAGRRYSGMSVAEERAIPPSAEMVREQAPLLVIAERSGLRAKIAAVLADGAMPPSLRLADAAALDEGSLDPSTLVVCACEVDRPAQVTGLRRLRRQLPAVRIVVVSSQATATAVRRTLDAGADALVLEQELEQALVATIHAVQGGQSVVPRNIRAGVERPYLSHRERQVMTLVCRGMTNAEVAESLYLAESTIKSHMASIFTQFGVHSRKEAVAVFLDLDLAMAEPNGTGRGPRP